MSGTLRLPRRVEVVARAKLNLGLAVGPARADGYHEIATVFQSITLADTVIAVRSRRGFRLRIRHEDASVRGRALPVRPGLVPAGADRAELVAWANVCRVVLNLHETITRY